MLAIECLEREPVAYPCRSRINRSRSKLDDVSALAPETIEGEGPEAPLELDDSLFAIQADHINREEDEEHVERDGAFFPEIHDERSRRQPEHEAKRLG